MIQAISSEVGCSTEPGQRAPSSSSHASIDSGSFLGRPRTTRDAARDHCAGPNTVDDTTTTGTPRAPRHRAVASVPRYFDVVSSAGVSAAALGSGRSIMARGIRRAHAVTAHEILERLF